MNHSNHIKRIILAAVMRHMIRNNRNCDFTWEKNLIKKSLRIKL